MVLVLVVALALALAGYFGVRWWTGDSHRDQQFASTVNDMPGVTKTGRQDGRVYVGLDPDAAATDIAAVLTAIDERARDPEGEAGVATMGDARMFIFDGVDEDWAATVLLGLGSVHLPHAKDVDVPAKRGLPVNVEVDGSGSAIGAARRILRAASARPDLVRTGFDLRVTEPHYDFGSYGVVSLQDLQGTRVRSRLTELDRAAPLTRWHPALSFPKTGPSVSLLLPSGDDASTAVQQARSLLGAKADISYQIGRDGTRVTGDADPTRATRLIDELTSPHTTVIRLAGDLSRIVVTTSYAQLPGVLKTVDDAGVDVIDVRWDGGELDRPVDVARGALPTVERLRRLGYTTVWVSPTPYPANSPQRIGVSLLHRDAAGQEARVDPSSSTRLARAIRSLHWHGRAEVHVAVATGEGSFGNEQLEDHIFYSTAGGRATKGPHSHEVDIAVTRTWNKTARR